MFLNIEHLSFSYGSKRIINDACLKVSKGETVIIQGVSASWKTTLFKVISGLEVPARGSIHIDQDCIFSNNGACINPEKRHVGFIFQDYAVFPHMTVYENIKFGIYKMPKSLREPYIMSLIRDMGLEGNEHVYPHMLYGGQMQRVAIARTLANRPKILLMDEPFSNLDEPLKDSLIPKLKSIFKKYQLTVLIATHHQRDIDLLDARVIILDNGVLKEKKSRKTRLYIHAQ